MKIGERGQVTIPKDIRYQYGLLPQVEVEFVPEERGILIRKKTLRCPVDEVYGILKGDTDTDSYIEAVRGR
jgi:AbrB family looped-hinge helix DNA binding protein